MVTDVNIRTRSHLASSTRTKSPTRGTRTNRASPFKGVSVVEAMAAGTHMIQMFVVVVVEVADVMAEEGGNAAIEGIKTVINKFSMHMRIRKIGAIKLSSNSGGVFVLLV